MTPEELTNEIEMSVALLASATSPAEAAAILRRIADEIERAQPLSN